MRLSKKKKIIPEGYRKVKTGELILDGDQWYKLGGRPRLLTPAIMCIGEMRGGGDGGLLLRKIEI